MRRCLNTCKCVSLAVQAPAPKKIPRGICAADARIPEIYGVSNVLGDACELARFGALEPCAEYAVGVQRRSVVVTNAAELAATIARTSRGGVAEGGDVLAHAGRDSLARPRHCTGRAPGC